MDFLTKKHKRTEGGIPGYYVKEQHEAIIEPEIFDYVRPVISVCCGTDETGKRQAELKKGMTVVVAELTERCINENAKVALDQDEYNERYDGLVERYEAVKAEYDEATQEIADRTTRKKQMEQFIRGIEKQELIGQFNEELWSSLVDYVTVYSGKRMVVSFKDGTEI